MKKLDKEVVENRIENFFGYGNLNSPVWIIGMEEGISINGVLRYLPLRFELTRDKTTVDIVDGMTHQDGRKVKDHLKWYEGSKVPLQPTLKKLIKLLLAYENNDLDLETISNNEIREYQQNSLGRYEGNNAVLELMPLPSNTIKEEDWFYDFLVPNLKTLKSRTKYLETYKESRKIRLHKLIDENKPEVLICYSYKYLNDWKYLLFGETIDNQINHSTNQEIYHHYINGETHLFITPQPSYLRKNEDWETIAIAIQNRNN